VRSRRLISGRNWRQSRASRKDPLREQTRQAIRTTTTSHFFARVTIVVVDAPAPSYPAASLLARDRNMFTTVLSKLLCTISSK
jgi:hypothetical protein